MKNYKDFINEIIKNANNEERLKPEDEQKYYFVESHGIIDWNYWENDATDFNFYIIGNCYLTKDEAMANREQWIAFYGLEDGI